MDMENSVPLPSLSSDEAAVRLARVGPNSIPQPGGRGWRTILAGAAREPMYLLLAAAAALYLLLGELLEGVVLAGTVALTMGLTWYQQGRTERALQALRQLSAPTAVVVRDGRQTVLPSAELVPGDLVVLAEGDRVPADALLLRASGMRTDESMLTGESEPVGKLAAEFGAPRAAPGGDGLPWIYAGTLVVQGHGMAQVRTTGAASEIGRLGAALDGLAPPPSPLRLQSALLARRLAWSGLALSAVLVLLLGSRDGAWMAALLAGLALSMSMLPEEFPVILTIFPALGARRLARRNVLTRNLGAIETLGAASVLCVDKTGTLTENRMAVGRIWAAGHMVAPAERALPAEHGALLALAVRASRPESADPMELAFARLVAARDIVLPGPSLRLVHEYGLTPARPAMVQVWEGGASSTTLVAAKGAPEFLLGLCALTDPQRAAALLAAEQMAGQGLRVLAIAEASHAGPRLPDDIGGFTFRLRGLAGLADPLRAGIPAAVADCRAAGVRVLMITGDHPVTASAIARQAGLAKGGVLTGAELAAMDDQQMAAALAGASVCARIRPEQKLRIVHALQRSGAVVAMTGDGVNDAPALRAADVGIAMGMRGTDVAREAAELTLLDDQFTSVVAAIRGGRRIHSNMRKAMIYVLAMHAPIAGLALLPALMNWPILLYPMHIVFLELIIDPACSLAFEQEHGDPDLMRRPPRAAGAPLIDRQAVLGAMAQGGAVLAVLALAYGAAAALLPASEARSFGFAALVLSNLALLQASRRKGADMDGRRRNPAFAVIAVLAVLLLLATVYWPPLASAFHMAPLPPFVLAAAGGCGLLVWMLLEAGRLIVRRRFRALQAAAGPAYRSTS